jgi:hypothetical protein
MRAIRSSSSGHSSVNRETADPKNEHEQRVQVHADVTGAEPGQAGMDRLRSGMSVEPTVRLF